MKKLYKIFKQIRYVLYHSTSLIIGCILSLFVKRDNNMILLGVMFKTLDGKFKDYFTQNPKYFYLYLKQFQNEYKPIWITDNNEIIKILNKRGYYDVYKRNSLKGIYYALKAKYWISSFLPYPTYQALSKGAICINLWHGTGFKKQGFDNNKTLCSNYTNFIKQIFSLLNENYNFFNSNCEYERRCHISGFGLNENAVKIWGYPRLDCFTKDFKNVDMLMESDFKKIKELKNSGKTIILYAPTWRDTGENISGWLFSKTVNDFFEANNIILIAKLHPMDPNCKIIKSDKNIYVMDSDSDTYAVMKYIDIMIADYSSIYCDFLLLDRPIIFYPFDLKKYLSECVELYRPYNEISPGIKAYNEKELIEAITKTIAGQDEYKDARKTLRNDLYKYQDGQSCERIIDFIRGLNT